MQAIVGPTKQFHHTHDVDPRDTRVVETPIAEREPGKIADCFLCRRRALGWQPGSRSVAAFSHRPECHATLGPVFSSDLERPYHLGCCRLAGGVVVCSACGYENQAGNRYCGMCGIPLPHRPLTTAGAQSTASLTRPLAENAGPLEPRASGSQTRTDVASEPPSSRDVAQPSQDPDMDRDTPASEAAAPHFELVPEIPLDEYVQNFRYVPPSDPEESTMRGETSVLRPELLRPELVPPETSAPSNGASAPPVETATATTEAAPPASADDVRERLGLEVDSTPEERSDRPRFLDFNEPPHQ